MRGQYLDDQLHGQWTWWQRPEWEKLERGYHCGDQHGREEAVYPGGQVGIRRSFYLGKRHGLEERFDAAGNPTFQGTWCYGHPVDEHRSWDAARTATCIKMVDGVPARPAEDTKTNDTIVKNLADAVGPSAKTSAIGQSIKTEYRAAYLVHLWRLGRVDVAADPELWELFGEAAGLLSGEEVVAFLRKAKIRGSSRGILPYLSPELDRIVMQVYQRDPAPIDAAWAALPAPMNHVVALVRARFGRDIGKALHQELPQLAKKHGERYGLGDILWPDDQGVLTLQSLCADEQGTRTPVFDQLLAFFGTFAEWLAALRTVAFQEADENVARVYFRTYRDVIDRATPEEMVKLIDGILPYSDAPDWIHRALTGWRSDDAATLARIALEVKDTALRKWPTVATAIKKYIAEGKAPPQGLNEAYEAGTDRTAVVLTTEAQLQEAAAPPAAAVLDEESRFEAVAAEVSPALWSGKSELQTEIYRCAGRVLGKPIWLQSEEDAAGPFLMQFDEDFCPINLGDCGMMYVFGETAFRQCH